MGHIIITILKKVEIMRTALFASALVLAFSGLAFANQADTIAQEADKRLHGFGDSTATLKMTLVNPSGQTAERALRVQNLETGDGDRSLMIFDTPRDVAGTALLTHTQPGSDDLQWLFLPAISRVKQIAAGNKSGPFMGSEFAFEDIVTPYWQKYTYSFVREEKCEALTCFVIERKPKDANSGYTRQQVWIDKQDYLIRRVDYYDRKNTLLKTYTATGFQKVQGNWRPALMLMVNAQNRKQTRLEWSEFKFKTGLKKDDFTENALKRAR